MNINLIHNQDINDYQETSKCHDTPDTMLKYDTMNKITDELQTENSEHIDFNKLNKVPTYIFYIYSIPAYNKTDYFLIILL